MVDIRDTSVFIKQLSEVHPSINHSLRWRQSRTYCLSDSVEILEENQHENTAKISVVGCLRGVPLFAHSLLHFSQVGVGRIVKVSRVNVKSVNKREGEMEEDVMDSVEVDVNKQDSMETEAVPDGLLGEQTWPEEDEMMQGEGGQEGGSDSEDTEGDEDGKDKDEDEEYYAEQEQIESSKKTVYATTLPATNKDG
jgi:pre-rRNA-processing protein TSR1